jgi:hypothetical protein
MKISTDYMNWLKRQVGKHVCIYCKHVQADLSPSGMNDFHGYISEVFNDSIVIHRNTKDGHKVHTSFNFRNICAIAESHIES